MQMRHVPYQHDLVSMGDYYRAADIYLQASRADTFPNVVLESLACGTPVIGTRVGGIPEQILDHQTGYLVEPGDWLSMAELTIKLIQDKDLRTRMGKLAAEDAQKRFQLDRMINSYIDWYYELLDKKAP
jgi:glycosyltransferase involved in cell wall biosynthesis